MSRRSSSSLSSESLSMFCRTTKLCWKSPTTNTSERSSLECKLLPPELLDASRESEFVIVISVHYTLCSSNKSSLKVKYLIVAVIADLRMDIVVANTRLFHFQLLVML
mmetsp:Transcript_13644/g.15681  ORF Transcript_13644/g.15681 Transcript_13644/m.15681 type:complete len:108 (-) Transcript_13644:12-335(-)